jgi:His/Glu/Gln/Arg/opine family amino acid ABC transporter permease subunit
MSGLDFGLLWQRAGFQVAESLLTVGPDDTYVRVVLAGVANTLTVAALALPLATVLGVVLGLLRLTRHPLLHRALALLVEPVRNTPVLLQLFVWYALLLQLPSVRQAWQPLPGVFLSNRGLAMPLLHGASGSMVILVATALALWHTGQQPRWMQGAVFASGVLALMLAGHAAPPLQLDVPAIAGLGLQGGWSLSPEFTALVIGLTIFHATYVADIVRGAVLSVPAGQVDAASALGMRPATVAAQIVYPYAARVGVPPYANQCLMLVKNSTLAIAIGYQELMAIVNTMIAQTGRAIEGMTLAAGFYVGISLLLAFFLARYNRRVNRHGIEGTGPLRLRHRFGLPALRSDALWASPLRAALSVTVLSVAALGLWLGLRWAVLDAVWSGPATACANATGACWAAVTENSRLLWFGTIPAAQRAQASVACGLLLLAVGALVWPGLRLHWRLGVAVAAALGVAGVLGGHVVGSAPLPPVSWGGLLVTLALSLAAIALALPAAIALALMRRSAHRGLRWPATTLIELSRGIPLVAQLLLVVFWVPLLFGGDWSGAKFQLALAALALHTACLLAEVLRGALQAVPQSQTTSAQALGMRPATVLWSIVLPQARRIAAPAALGVFVGAVKDTSLVMVIGVFDVLNAAKAVVANPGWRSYDVEVYAAVALLYLALCLPLARLALRMERSNTSKPSPRVEGLDPLAARTAQPSATALPVAS